MKLLVIIVTYNGLRWLDKCLTSIIRSSMDADIFIVDNGSTDGTVEFIKEHFPNVNLKVSEENLGFGKANNIGFQYAIDNQYDYVYLLNQDAWIEPDTFEKLINISNANSEFGIISPMQANRELTKLDYNFVKCCPESLLSDLACHQQLKTIYPVEFVMAAHWLIPIATIKKVGGFSPIFPHYGEDHNYIHRTKFNGLQIGIAPDVFVVHDREFRKDSISKQQYMFYVDNLIILASPIIQNRFLRIANNYFQVLFKDKRKFRFSHIVKFIKQYRSISKYRKLGFQLGSFLN